MLPVSRRGLLAFSGFAALGLAGCAVSDPRILGGPQTPPPEPTPTPTPDIPGLSAALTHEAELGSLATQLVAEADRLRLGPGVRQVAAWAAPAHDTHLTALLGPRPTDRTPTAAPPASRPTPTSRLDTANSTAAVAALQSRLDAALADYRRSAGADRGPSALLWGSLAAYARSVQTALGRDAPRPAPAETAVRPLQVWSDAEAAQQLLRQTHALVYGYQVAIGWLRRPESQAAYAVLTRRRELRDRLTAMLRDRGQTAPAAEPAYALPAPPTDRDSAAGLLRQLEAAYTPFAGAWLAAAADDRTRGWALEALEQAAQLSVEWGGPLAVWPGWPA